VCLLDSARVTVSGVASSGMMCLEDVCLPSSLAHADNAILCAASLATLPAAWLTRQRGRKASIVVAALCYLLGVGLNAGAVNLAMLVVGRLWQGAGVGFSLQASDPDPVHCP